MRNLKKTLCLVLALVFVLGLCTVGAADLKLTDIAEVDKDYVSAVKALAGLGIISGKDDGSFGPKEVVTREQAAKFIAYICLGPDYAEIYPATAAANAFSDVTKDMRMAKYIAYCVNNHIIDGYGNGKFGPKDPVTQAQLCKMLLAAAGYGKKGEFTGKDWDAGVFEAAVQTPLFKNFKGVDFESKEGATREQTALLAYNTLMRVDQVVLSKDTESYQKSTAGKFADSAWDLKEGTGIVLANVANGAASKMTELDSKLNVKTDSDSDAALIGHKVLVRYSKDDDTGLCTAYYIEDLSTEAAYSKDLDATIAKATSGYVWTNGEKADGNISTIPTANVQSYIFDETKAIIGCKKVSKYFVAQLKIDDKTGKITADDGKGNADSVVTVANAPEGAKTGDIVTVEKLGSVYTATACTKVEGVLISQMAPGKTAAANSWNNKTYFVSGADSVNVTVGTTVLKQFDGTGLTPSAKTTYTLYLDKFGKVFAFMADDPNAGVAKVENDVYFVYAWNTVVADTTNEYGEPVPGGTTYNIQVIDAEGNATVLTADKDYTGATAKKVYTKTVDAKGKNVITVLNDRPATGDGARTYTEQAFTKGNFDTYFKSDVYDFSNATWIVVGKNKADGDAKGSNLKAYVDSNIDTANAAGSFIFKEIDMGTTTVKQVVAVWYDVVKTTGNASSNYIYVASGTKTETRIEGDKSYDYFTAYENGKAIAFKVGYDKDGNAPVVAAGFYTGYTVDSAGAYTLKAASDPVSKTVEAVALKMKDQKNFILNGKLYVFQGTGDAATLDLTNVVLIDKTGTSGITTIAELEAAIVKNDKNTYKIDFVMVASGATKSIGGGMILLTEVVKP